MPLSNENVFGIRPLTEAINKLPSNPTIIRQLGLFKPTPLTTTYVSIESKENELTLVEAVPRGTAGQAVQSKRGNPLTFDVLHLPKDDVVRADDVQNVRVFGSGNKIETVASRVNDKLEQMKLDIELTREHLMLGALMGKLLNADGTQMIDLYDRFGIERKEYTLALSNEKTVLGKEIDEIKTAQGKLLRGEALSGYIVLASEAFMQAFIYHKSIYDVYTRFESGFKAYEGDTNIAFKYKGIEFIQYNHEFASGEKIADGEAILIPKGTRNTFREYFAPADMNATVNTLALPYYASRAKLDHDKGWSLHAQSNPLPLVLRPELVATLKMS